MCVRVRVRVCVCVCVCVFSQALLVRQTALGLPRATTPKRLLNPESGKEEELDLEGVDPDQFLLQLSGGLRLLFLQCNVPRVHNE